MMTELSGARCLFVSAIVVVVVTVGLSVATEQSRLALPDLRGHAARLEADCATAGLEGLTGYPRYALVDVPDFGNATVAPTPPFAAAARLRSVLHVLRTGGWAALLLLPGSADEPALLEMERWLADPLASPYPTITGSNRNVVASPSVLPPLLDQPFRAPPARVFVPPRSCAGRSAAAVATAAASLSGAVTVLWLRHWAFADAALDRWPRYYGLATSVDATEGPGAQPVAWEPEADGPGNGPRVLDAFRADAARTNGSRALTLCSVQAYPALQLGVCPDGRGLTQLEGVGVILGRDALVSMASGPAVPALNVLAHRPAFPLVAAMAAAVGALGAADGDRASLRLLAAAFGDGAFGSRGWHAVLTAPGSLCGNASALSPAHVTPEPDVVAWPSHPDAASLNASTRREGAGAPTGASLLREAAAAVPDGARTAWADAAWLDMTHTVAAAEAAPVSTVNVSSTTFTPPGAALARYARGGCRPAVPFRRDILLALEFNNNYVDANFDFLHELYDRYFPTVLMFADTSTRPARSASAGGALPALPPFGWSDGRRGVHCCRTGVPKPGYSAHVCMERVAPLAVGRVGVLWTSDDALVHVWRLDGLDARRVWAMRILEHRWRLDAGGAAGPLATAEDHPVVWDRNVEAWAEREHGPDVRAMQARNFAAAAPERLRAEAAVRRGTNASAPPLLRVTSGYSDTFYLPRAVVPVWGAFFTENASVGLMQEHAIPSAVAATAFLPHVYVLDFAGVPRPVAGGTGGNATQPEGLRVPEGAEGSHPWKWSIGRTRRIALDVFRRRGVAR